MRIKDLMIDYQKLFRPLTEEEKKKLKPFLKEWAKDFRAILDHYKELKNKN